MESPVRPGTDRPWLILVGAGLAALIAWTVQQDYFTAPALSPEAPGSAPTARARANLPSLFSTDDYPAAALRRNEGGTVGFTVSVNRRGKVDRCVVTSSSGSESLDGATCGIIQRRARFEPARDANGQAVADKISSRTRWQLADD